MTKRSYNKTTLKQREEVVRLYNSGMGYREVAEATGMSLGAAQYWLVKSNEINRRPRGVRPRLDRDEVVRLYRDELLTYPEIVEKLGCGYSTVSMILREALTLEQRKTIRRIRALSGK